MTSVRRTCCTAWIGSLLTVVLTACSSVNSQTNVYATLQEARQAGAIANAAAE